MIEEMKISHIEALANRIYGKVVNMSGIDIDPDVYFYTDDDENRVDGSDYQLCTIRFYDEGEIVEKMFQWNIEEENFICMFHK